MQLCIPNAKLQGKEYVAQPNASYFFQRDDQDRGSRYWKQYGASKLCDSGAGLGLAISKVLIEAHGGQIWARTIPQEGRVSTLRFLMCEVLPELVSSGVPRFVGYSSFPPITKH